jgi:hypothetical protein
MEGTSLVTTEWSVLTSGADETRSIIRMMKSRTIRLAGIVARMGEEEEEEEEKKKKQKKNAYRILVGKRQLERLRRRFEADIEMDVS